MMQVQELSAVGLKREFKITVEANEIEANLVARLTEIGQTARIDGFRPGKVPMPILRKHYGQAAHGEVVERTVQNVTDKALTERSLRAAMQPRIEIETMEPGQALVYTLSFEVLPTVKPMDFKSLKLERLTADVTDVAVDDMIARMAKSVRGPEVVAELRPAKMGDVLLIDFDGTVDGKAFPGMKGSSHRLELGSNSFIEGFENQLVGAKKGDEKTVNVTFPENYHAAELAGKKAVFKVNVKDLLAHAPIVIDEALAKEVGFETIEALRGKVRERMAEDYANIGREMVKRALMDELAEAHDFEVPQGMVDAEFDGIWERLQQERVRGVVMTEDKGKSDDDLKTEYRAIAERRVRLGLLLAEVGKANDLRVEPAELRQALINETRQYPGREKEVFEFFTKTPGALERLRAPLLEEKVVDWIIGQASVTDKKVSADDLLKAPEEADKPKAKSTKAKSKKSA